MKHEFQTEVNQLLKLFIHSLYSNKDIFLREIVSNASDALDKLKYLTVSDDKFKSIPFDPKIDISFNEEAKTLTIQDCGIGMNEDDLNNNLGTIAHSGTKAFIEQLSQNGNANSDLIGQFGVGFYSAFMAATKIDVYTRKAGDSEKAWHWSSDGTNSYDIEELPLDSTKAKLYDLDRENSSGTAIEIHLNDDSKDFASRWKIDELIKKYSNHIAFPIYLHYTQTKYDKDGKAEGTESKVEKVNSASALWKRSKSELKKEDYNEFYKSLSHDGSDPLMYIHTHAEGTQEYTTLFYVPEVAPFDMYQGDCKSGLKLYVKRVFITDDDRELLPAYLRFVRGIIDSEDLPLNVSREILQQNRILETIKSASVKKLISEFKKLCDKGSELAVKKEEELSEDEKTKLRQYKTFVKNYNRPIKEGLYFDYTNRDDIAEIVRFKSTAPEGTGDDNWTSFAGYVSRMKAEQKAIYYIVGNDEKNLRASPLLEAYKKKGFEVLILSDEFDDLVITGYGKYKDYEIKSVNRAGSDEELGVDKEEAKKKEEDFKPVQEKIKKALGDRVKNVVLSKRLSDSPSCIVVDENDPTLQMEKMMRAMGQFNGSHVKPILEVNGDHPIVKKIEGSTDETFISNISEVLFDQALLMGGEELADPSSFVKALNALI